MSNTQKRIISAIVLVAIVAFCMVQGERAVSIFILVTSILFTDEFYTNILGYRRKSLPYLLNQALLVSCFIFFNFIESSYGYYQMFVNAGIVLNVFLFIFLFVKRSLSESLLQFARSMRVAPFLLIGLPSMAIAALLTHPFWERVITILLVINFGTDIGAWFCGKKFGKHKLWEAVSPNKTIEGAVGGAIVSSICALALWQYFFLNVSLFHVLLFPFLSITAQLGDLFQSKLKRIVNVKDSSQLIPGHGGVYDRIDSLIVVAPFYAAFILSQAVPNTL